MVEATYFPHFRDRGNNSREVVTAVFEETTNIKDMNFQLNGHNWLYPEGTRKLEERKFSILLNITSVMYASLWTKLVLTS